MAYLMQESNKHFNEIASDALVIDLRSDTLTLPTAKMYEAMTQAGLGDEGFGEDPTVNALEHLTATMLAKEAAVFVPSGTMANLIALMIHCDRRNGEVLLGDLSYMFKFSKDGIEDITDIKLTNVANNRDGTVDLDLLEKTILKNKSKESNYLGFNNNSTMIQLICIENTHNLCGGKPLPLSYLENLRKLAEKYCLNIHMDGARLFNASVAQNVSVKEIVKHVDSVCFCLSKNLGTPAGAMLAGSYKFIERARRLKKHLGGTMRQSGILAAAGIVALKDIVNLLKRDHQRTYQIAKAINDSNSEVIKVDLADIHTNILMIYVNRTIANSTASNLTATDVAKRLVKITDEEIAELGEKIAVKSCICAIDCLRLTLYHQVTDKDVQLIIKKLRFIIREMER